MYGNEKDKKKVKKTKGNSSKLAKAKKQMAKAGASVLKTRQDIKKLDSEPKGHFNKNIIGSPKDVRNNLERRLYRKTKERDSLRKVVRNFKKK